jgi:hypothetical protein
MRFNNTIKQSELTSFNSLPHFMQDWIETKDDYLDTPNPRLPDREHFAVLLTNLGDIQLPNFMAIDKDGRAVLVAEVKGHPHNFKDAKRRNYALLRLIDVLKFATKNLIPFAMLVDKINIEFSFGMGRIYLNRA